MDELRRTYRRALPGRIAALEGARDAALAGDVEAGATVRRVAHSLRGSGGTYGFPEVSAAAAAVEESTDIELAPRLDALLTVLRTIALSSDAAASILVIEDEPEHALLISTVLGKHGHDVAVVRTPDEARAALSQRPPALILLDLFLADTDGRTLLLELREQPATADVPIIVVSGHSGAHAKAECFALGANGFVEKPIDAELLEALVRAQLRNQVRTPAAAADDGHWILLVEDDDLVASVVRHRLEREGFRVLHFEDGMKALAALDTAPPISLAILDVKVPGMDGFDLLRRLRARPATQETPIVILTSLGAERDVLRGFELGANDYITKPFSPVEVMARVKRLIAT